MDYQKYTFSGEDDVLGILSVFLFEDGFEGVEELHKQLQAYHKSSLPIEALSVATKNFMELNGIEFYTETVTDQNWNAIWESSFQPIEVGNQVQIRASHHPPAGFTYDLLIEPKMSFGTGHHATTYLVLEEMLQHDLNGKSILDFGTGTGLLAILAEKMGAESILGIDIDPNCIENTKENFELNKCTKCQFELGDLDLAEHNKYNFILANVNRNALLDRIDRLCALLAPGGYLLLSGFFPEDVIHFKTALQDKNYHCTKEKQRDKWMLLVINH